MKLIAIDVALLLPDEVAGRVRALNAALPASESQGLTLDSEHLPHLTLAQSFIAAGDLSRVTQFGTRALDGQHALRVQVTGSVPHGTTVWLAIEPTLEIAALHRRMMDALRDVEAEGGGREAFEDEDARPNDVRWVSRYRADASDTAFRPHITVGHARHPPHVDPFAFRADTVALCRLGRFCTCRRMLARWTLPA